MSPPLFIPLTPCILLLCGHADSVDRRQQTGDYTHGAQDGDATSGGWKEDEGRVQTGVHSTQVPSQFHHHLPHLQPGPHLTTVQVGEWVGE